MYIFLYLFLIFLGLIGCIKKNSKYFFVLTLIFTLIIVYFHPYCADYKNYENVYYNIANGVKYYDTGLGWYFICLIFSKLSISFRLFKTLICGISLLLINSTLRKYIITKNQRYFYVLYLIFPLLLHCIQFRFMLSLALLVYSLKFMYDNTLKDKISILIIMMIASLIHSSLIIILGMYFFLLIKPFKKHIKKITILSLFIIAYMFFFHQDILIEIISKFINEVRIQRYFTIYNNPNNIATMCLDILAMFINYLPLNFMLKRLTNDDKEKIGKKYSLLELNSKMNFFFIIIIPFLILDNNFIRILEVLIMLTNLSLLILCENGFKHTRILKMNVYQLLFISSTIYFLIFIPKLVVFQSLLV